MIYGGTTGSQAVLIKYCVNSYNIVLSASEKGDVGCYFPSILSKEQYATTPGFRTFYRNSHQWFIKKKTMRLGPSLLLQNVPHGARMMTSSSFLSSSSPTALNWKNYLPLPQGRLSAGTLFCFEDFLFNI